MVAIALNGLFRKHAVAEQKLTGNELVRKFGISPVRLPIEAHDVQGLVFRGYGKLHAACYPLLAIEDPARTRRWLEELASRTTSGILSPSVDTAIHVAFTYRGLMTLETPPSLLQGFSQEFIEGMAGTHHNGTGLSHRNRFLGDEGESAPGHWQWGGPSTREIHLALLLYAKDARRLESLLEDLRSSWKTAGLAHIRTLETHPLTENAREHFGFSDGISQPAIEGYHPASSPLHRVKAGEFILGYENEYGLHAERPLIPASDDPFGLLPLDFEGSPLHDAGRNGTYLVIRQLQQDVPKFRDTLQRLTRHPDGAENIDAQARLAAKMVGRWPSGAPLIEAPDDDNPDKARSNDFRYHRDDPEGLRCPLGAHVRRANPRDALDPSPGTDRSLHINHRHRILRRGRIYGTPLPPGETDDKDRGLIFIAVNANIRRQFEFIQHSWIADSQFNGFFGESDPIVGTLASNRFSVPGDPLRSRYTGLPRFVTTAGGAYFFMPGRRALAFLAKSLRDGGER